MHANKQVYKEAFERAREGKSRTLIERILFRFKDHYTQTSREQGERDGLLARQQAEGQTASTTETAH